MSAPSILRTGDQLVLIEHGGRRLRELGKLSFGAARSFERDPLHLVVGVFEDGAILTAPNTSVTVRREQPDYTVGLSVTPYHLWAGDVVDTLAGPPSPPLPHFRPGPASTAYVPGRTGCLPETRYAAAGSRLIIADASAGLVMSLDRFGALDTIFQSPERGRVSQEMGDGALAFLERVEGTREGRRAFLERVGNVGDPLRGVWGDLLWDGRLLWLRRAVPCFVSERTGPYVWDVVDVGGGSPAAVVEVPSALRLLAVAPDRVLAVVTDELGVERLGVHRILR